VEASILKDGVGDLGERFSTFLDPVDLAGARGFWISRKSVSLGGIFEHFPGVAISLMRARGPPNEAHFLQLARRRPDCFPTISSPFDNVVQHNIPLRRAAQEVKQDTLGPEGEIFPAEDPVVDLREVSPGAISDWKNGLGLRTPEPHDSRGHRYDGPHERKSGRVGAAHAKGAIVGEV